MDDTPTRRSVQIFCHELDLYCVCVGGGLIIIINVFITHFSADLYWCDVILQCVCISACSPRSAVCLRLYMKLFLSLNLMIST